MVVMVIGIVVAITLPTFVRSIRGNRLRMAARTVIMAGRYARNMAILNQREMMVELQPESSRVTVRAVRTFTPDATQEAQYSDPWGGEEAPWVEDEDRDDEDEADEEAVPLAGGKAEIVRVLDGVKIVEVEILEDPGEDREDFPDEARQVLYRSNGQCTPYRVTLMDEENESVVVEVDRLGSVETEKL
jgi:type II secretory pathway pseudopilin PulG